VGTVCTYACGSGYFVSSGTAARACDTAGAWTGTSLVCALLPPTIPSGQRVYVFEVRCSAGWLGCESGVWLPLWLVGWGMECTLVVVAVEAGCCRHGRGAWHRVYPQNTTTDGAVGDPVYAYHNASDVAVTYSIVGGNDTVPFFKINFCSGQLRLIQEGLSALTAPFYRLLVEVRSNSMAASSAQANVTVVVVAVPHPPTFNDMSYTRSVFENATIGSLLSPCVSASDPDLDVVTYSVFATPTYNGLLNVSTAGACVWRRCWL
jgi:hypothetical protein